MLLFDLTLAESQNIEKSEVLENSNFFAHGFRDHLPIVQLQFSRPKSCVEKRSPTGSVNVMKMATAASNAGASKPLLFACSKCFSRHPFEELSQGQQLCKVGLTNPNP